MFKHGFQLMLLACVSVLVAAVQRQQSIIRSRKASHLDGSVPTDFQTLAAKSVADPDLTLMRHHQTWESFHEHTVKTSVVMTSGGDVSAFGEAAQANGVTTSLPIAHHEEIMIRRSARKVARAKQATIGPRPSAAVSIDGVGGIALADHNARRGALAVQQPVDVSDFVIRRAARVEAETKQADVRPLASAAVSVDGGGIGLGMLIMIVIFLGIIACCIALVIKWLSRKQASGRLAALTTDVSRVKFNKAMNQKQYSSYRKHALGPTGSEESDEIPPKSAQSSTYAGNFTMSKSMHSEKSIPSGSYRDRRGIKSSKREPFINPADDEALDDTD